MRMLTLAVVTLAVGLIAPATWAAPKKTLTPPVEDASKRARAHFDKGVRLYKQARYQEAITEFEAAYQERPHGIIFFNIAQSYEKLGDIARALRAYHQYLRELPEADDRHTVEVAMKNLEKRLAEKGVQQLLVYSNPPSAQVLIDGRKAGTTPFTGELELGTHTVGVEIAGYALNQRTVELTPNASIVLDFTLERVTDTARVQAPDDSSNAGDAPTLTQTTPRDPQGAPAMNPYVTTSGPAPQDKPRVWTYVAGGVGVAALATAVVLGMSAKKAESDLHASLHDRQTATDLAHSAQGRATGANLFYGIAGAAGVATAALFFVEGRF